MLRAGPRRATVQLEPDPVALTARVDGDGDASDGAAEQAARALAELARAGITVDNFSLGQPSLDEVFLALTGTTRPTTDRTTPSADEGRRRHEHRDHHRDHGTRPASAPSPRRAARRQGAAAAAQRAVGVADLRLAGDAQDQARAGAALRRHGVPDHDGADVHVPLRRRAGRLDRRSTSSSCCRASW